MTDATASVYAPRAPHPDSLADPRLMIRDTSETLLAHYCHRHRVGAVYDLRSQAWSMFTPMTAQEFIGSLPKLGVHLADTSDLQSWIDAITAMPAQFAASGLN